MRHFTLTPHERAMLERLERMGYELVSTRRYPRAIRKRSNASEPWDNELRNNRGRNADANYRKPA